MADVEHEVFQALFLDEKVRSGMREPLLHAVGQFVHLVCRDAEAFGQHLHLVSGIRQHELGHVAEFFAEHVFGPEPAALSHFARDADRSRDPGRAVT